MAKVRTNSLDRKEQYRVVGNLIEIVSGIRNKNESIDFFFSVLSSSELLMIARRIQIAEMLLEEKTYEEIRKELKVSYQSIAKVYHWLYEGRDGIQKMIKNHQSKKIKKEKNNNGYQDGSLLNKYHHHRAFRKLFS